MARIFLPMPGSDFSSAAMLVSSPTAMSVISPGTRIDLPAHELHTAFGVQARRREPLAHSTCFMYCVAVEMPAYTGTPAHFASGNLQ